nr:uncharacterized protein LOC109191246 [Ipomoea batatas]
MSRHDFSSYFADPSCQVDGRTVISGVTPKFRKLVYFDRVQFKGMRVNRTYPTIVGWSAELARKRVKEENKAGSFGRGTMLPRISKHTDIAAATSRQNDQPPVAALNIPSSSVDKVAGILQKLALTVGEFGEAMAEIGKQGTPANVMRKTFSGLSNMLNVASTIEATATPTSSQLDDIFFGSESFTTAVDALIFFPVLRHGYYFLICINVKASKLEIIDNKSLVHGVTMKDKYGDCTTLLVIALKEYLALGSSALFWKVDELTEEVVDMSWKESENYIDCGLFVMRHMETYKGTLKKWNPGFKKKARLNEEFLIGLRARLPFHPSTSISAACFNLLHMDIWGPYRVATIHGHHYFLTILDDHSRAVWVHLMKKKSEVRGLIISFCNRIENQFGTHVKFIRSDNGLEFDMSDLFCQREYYTRPPLHTLPSRIAELKGSMVIFYISTARALKFQANLPRMLLR